MFTKPQTRHFRVNLTLIVMYTMKLKHLILLFFFILIYHVKAWSQDNFSVKNIKANQLPQKIKYKGNIKIALQWTDVSGENFFIATETGIYKNKNNDSEEQNAELFAYHYNVRNDTLKQIWKLYDFIKDCPVDIEANFIKNAFKITDLNDDGTAEIWTMYKTACHGDVSPCTMKIIMYQGGQKFAMRGENKVRISEKEYMGGEYKFDAAFLEGDKKFRDFALRLWNDNILQSFE